MKIYHMIFKSAIVNEIGLSKMLCKRTVSSLKENEDVQIMSNVDSAIESIEAEYRVYEIDDNDVYCLDCTREFNQSAKYWFMITNNALAMSRYFPDELYRAN